MSEDKAQHAEDRLVGAIETIASSFASIAQSFEAMAQMYATSMQAAGLLGDDSSEEQPAQDTGAPAARPLMGSFAEQPGLVAPGERVALKTTPRREGNFVLDRFVLAISPRELVPHVRLYEVRIDGLRVREPLIAPEQMRVQEGQPPPDYQLVTASFFDPSYVDEPPVWLHEQLLELEIELGLAAPGPARITAGFVVEQQQQPAAG